MRLARSSLFRSAALTACSARMESVLTKLDGVGSVLIDVPTKVLTMDYDPAIISLEEIRDEVVKIGYNIEI